MAKHKCNNTNTNIGTGTWAHCAVCGGRMHEPGCTTPKRKGVDCPGQEYHTPEEMEAAGYGPASQFSPALAGNPFGRKRPPQAAILSVDEYELELTGKKVLGMT